MGEVKELLPLTARVLGKDYNYFRHWQRLGIWQQIHAQLRTQVRERMNKTDIPTAGISKRQSRTTREKRELFACGGLPPLRRLAWEVYGYDGGKLVLGRKRFILVDTLGLLLGVIVKEANFPERLGGAAVVMSAAQATDNLVLIWVEQGFSGSSEERVIQELCQAKVDVVCRTEPGATGITITLDC